MATARAGTQRFSCESHVVTGGVIRVWLGGEIGRSDAQELDRALRAAQAEAAMVILDLRAVVAIDATVVHLIRAADARTGEGKRLVILRGSGPIDSDIDGLRLDARMLWVEDPRRSWSADPFEVVTEAHANHVVLRVRGYIDISTGPRLGAALAAERRPLLLDLSGVDFMDATGIRLLLAARARARADGVDLELITSAAVDHTLGIANLREHFACAPPPTPLAR